MKTQDQDVWALQGKSSDVGNVLVSGVLDWLAEFGDSPDRARLIEVCGELLGMPE